MTEFKEYVCRKISDALSRIIDDGKLARKTFNNKGIFISNTNRGPFIKFIADTLLHDGEFLDKIDMIDLERTIFDVLLETQRKASMQERAAAIAKALTEKRNSSL